MPGGSGEYRQCLVKHLDDGGRLGQSRQAAEGKVEPRKTEDEEACDDQSDAQKDEDSSQFGHECA